MVYNPSSLIARGSFVSTGAATTIQIDPGVDYFYLKNRTQWGASANPGVTVQAEWFTGMGAGDAYTIVNSNGSNAMNAVAVTSNGFTLIDPDNPVTYAPVALANPAFSQAANAVFTSSAPHGLSVGDVVTLYGLTGAPQYAGFEYSVAAVGSTTTFTLLINTTGITQATAGFVQKVASPVYSPNRSVITKLSSSGTSTVITMSQVTDLTVGQYVRLLVPSVYGMSSNINGQLALITAVNTSPTVNSITVDYDSSGDGTFVFPVASAWPFTFAQVLPVGEVATILDGAESNQLYRGLLLGTSVVGAAADVIDWWAFKADLELDPVS